MSRRALSSILAVLLLSTTAQPEKLVEEKEKFVGAVKIVKTTTTQFRKESGKWIKTTGPDEETDEIPTAQAKAAPGQAEDEETDPHDSIKKDPDKERQGLGYDAGYDSSIGHYGFYKLDRLGNILEAVHYSPKGDLAGRDFHIYDATGKETEKACFAAEGTLLQKRFTSYDGKGNRIEEVSYRADGVQERKSTWTYDQKDSVTSESLLLAGKLSYRLTFDYRYDRVGNWVKRVSVTEAFDDDEVKSETMEVAERKITYR
jgi:hypothetical protein